VVEKRAKQLDAEERLNPSVKHGLFLGGWGKNPPWPFQVITDRQGKDSGAVALCAPFIKYYYNAETEKGLFWRLKADGHIMIGVTSYEFFPGNATNPYTDRSPQERYPEDKQIYASLDGYAHCFRRPSDHIPPAIPRAMVSQSDYIDCSNADLSPKRLPKKYSFAYSNLVGSRCPMLRFARRPAGCGLPRESTTAVHYRRNLKRDRAAAAVRTVERLQPQLYGGKGVREARC